MSRHGNYKNAIMDKEKKESFFKKPMMKSALIIVKAMAGITLLVTFGVALTKWVMYLWG